MAGSTGARSAAARTWSGSHGGSASGTVPSGTVPTTVSALDQFDLVADDDLAALDDARQHAALALQLGAEAVAQLVHPVARIANHRDLELGPADPDPLANRPLLDIVALDSDVLSDRAGLDVDGVEMLLGDEENLALRRVRVRAPLQAAARDRAAALVPLGAAALAGRGGEDTDDACHQATSLISAAAPLVERDRPCRCDVEGLRRPGGRNRDRKSTRLNSSHRCISYAVFC